MSASDPAETVEFNRAMRERIIALSAIPVTSDLQSPLATNRLHRQLIDLLGGNSGGGIFQADRVLYVAPSHPGAVDDANQKTPFVTIQAALNTIPSAIDSATARQVWTVLIEPGTYDEELSVDITRKRIILLGIGPWNLGTFNTFDWAPSGVRRNITVFTTDAVTIDGIRNAFSIQPFFPAGEGLTTHQSYFTRPRISGAIDVSNAIGDSFELTLSCEVFGTTGGSGGDSLIGGAAIVQSYIYHSRFRGKLTGANWNFQVSERTRFGGLVTVSGYSTIISCRFDTGMTTTSAGNAGILPGGFYNTDFAGTFTGPAASLRLDGATNYWFKTNGALLAGGATKVIQDDLVP